MQWSRPCSWRLAGCEFAALVTDDGAEPDALLARAAITAGRPAEEAGDSGVAAIAAEVGPASAIERQADRLRMEPGIAVDVSVEHMPELGEESEITVFRVVQEALTNIQRHAQARHASVLVRRLPGRVRVIIEDDGVGFDMGADTDRLGLAGIRERVALLEGTATLESRPGEGTTLVVEIPA